MPHKVEVDERIRSILLDWLIELHFKLKMFPQTLYMVVMIIDCCFVTKSVSKDNMQLIGAAALYIEVKYEETHKVLKLERLVHLAGI
jgi:cyclin B